LPPTNHSFEVSTITTGNDEQVPAFGSGSLGQVIAGLRPPGQAEPGGRLIPQCSQFFPRGVAVVRLKVSAVVMTALAATLFSTASATASPSSPSTNAATCDGATSTRRADDNCRNIGDASHWNFRELRPGLFALVRRSTHQCLTTDDGGLSLRQCDYRPNQAWVESNQGDDARAFDNLVDPDICVYVTDQD
jgi:hypothetical protein